jgi:hypothetical protein
VPGPLDVVEPCVTGMLDDDLGAAARAALALDRAACRAAALERSWSHSTALFLSHLVEIRTGAPLCSASSAPRVSSSRAE